MALTFTTTTKAIAKAGSGADATIVADTTTLTAWGEDIENTLCQKTRRNWIASFSDLPTTVKGALSEYTSSAIAKRIVAHSQKGYPIIGEAVTLLNMLDDDVKTGFEALKDFDSNTIKAI